jgi:hypothetical protein
MATYFYSFAVLWLILGGLTLLFSRIIGKWNAQLRYWIAIKFPFWTQMSGLPPEKVAYYLTEEFGRKQALVSGVIFLILSFVFLLIAIFAT